jgi:hypothetical protein
MDIQKLRAMRNNDFSKITSEFDKLANPGEKKSYDDDRIWKLTADKAGNASAVIRFLPRTEGDELPFVKIFSHSFQGPTGKWYIENSLTTLGENDPVGELNSKLWNSGSEANKEVARKQKRKLSFIANVYIVNDPAKPENNGKVMLFKFGKKIFDKITEAMNPEFADEQAVNPFDMWEGANFKLKIRNVEGYRNYDKSEFADKSALFDGNDEKLEELWKSEHGLKEFSEKKQFKSYEQLKTRLDKVLGFDGAPAAPKSKASDTVASIKDDDTSIIDKAISEDDEDLDYFKSLAESN